MEKLITISIVKPSCDKFACYSTINLIIVKKWTFMALEGLYLKLCYLDLVILLLQRPQALSVLEIWGGMAEMPYAKDAIDIMTSILLTAAKIRTQAGRLGFETVNIGTTTNIAEIRKYTEQSLVELPFKVATQKIAKTGAGCAGIGLDDQIVDLCQGCELALEGIVSQRQGHRKEYRAADEVLGLIERKYLPARGQCGASLNHRSRPTPRPWRSREKEAADERQFFSVLLESLP
jgi:hypothetical protein